jgi:hypothetical protein
MRQLPQGLVAVVGGALVVPAVVPPAPRPLTKPWFFCYFVAIPLPAGRFPVIDHLVPQGGGTPQTAANSPLFAPPG